MKQIVRFEGSLEDLREIIQEQMQSLVQQVNNSEPEELLSPTKAAKFLGVADSTLLSYQKRGLVTKYIMGNSPRYKKSELMNAFVKVESGRAA